MERYWDGWTWTGHTRPRTGYPPMPPPPMASPRGSLAGYGLRMGGWLIDWVIVGVVSTPVLLAFHAIQRTHTTVIRNGVTLHSSGYHVGGKGVLIHALIAILYGSLMCGATGQTLGMMAVRVRAVRKDTGGPIGLGRALVRGVLEYVLVLLLFLPWVLDMLFPLWDEARQTLHDKAAGTVVINS